MVSIVSDDENIKRSLATLVERCVACGAQIADDLVIKCLDKELSVEASPDGMSGDLIRLPHTAILPLKSFTFSLRGDEILLKSHAPDLPARTVALVESMLETFNLTHKIAAHKKTSSFLFLASQPDLIPAMMEARNEPHLRSLLTLDTGDKEKFILDTFFKSRALLYRGGKDAQPMIVLMPLIELLNHHFQGARYRNIEHENGNIIAVARSRFRGADGKQCFAFYGPNDSLDAWLTYNFVDDQPPYTRSVSLEIVLPDLGTIRVGAQGNMAILENLPQQAQDLRFYLPNITGKMEDRLDVTFLLIPGASAPRALRRVLSILIEDFSPGHPRHKEFIALAEEQVISKNIAFYEELKITLQNLKLNDPSRKDIQTALARVCDLQLARLRHYSTYARNMAAA